jgi:transmembrane sensor
MKSPRQDTQPISEQAAEWLCVLAEGGAAEQAAFLEWLKKSPRHVEEFLFASAAWQTLRELGSSQPMEVSAILADALTPGAVASNVVALGREPKSISTGSVPESPASAALRSVQEAKGSAHRMRPAHLRWAAGLVALLLAAVTGWWVLSSAPTYVTEIGEQRTIRLADGSVLYLNTHSRAHVRFSADVREVELLDGEALFVVAHDPARPFRVRTDEVLVQAVGTEFNVRRLAGNTRVSVIEGRVKVAEESLDTVELLAAGEEATIVDKGRIRKATVADIPRVVAWRERRLVFKAETLENVVAEINRYSTRQFRIEGERARATLLTATFDADKPESLATFLQQYSNLAVETRGEVLLIRGP